MKKTIELFHKKKGKEKITMLTCYDYSTAKFLNSSDIDAILVGDSLGMVFQGNNDTLPVTVDEMIYHAKAVRKGASDIFLVVDMPFLSYHTTTQDAILNCGRVIKESGANAVKIEGGEEIIDKVKGLVAAKIPVMGHLGLTPQSVNVFGGFKVQGKNLQDAKRILHDALLLQEAGCFSVVLECVPYKLAKLITEKLAIPTIGIGSGNVTDGQVLVINDIMGMFDDVTPKFVKKFGNVSQEIKN
ncbi:MAG TPA: 3-methyl-2-oxobutanoate hydroxymethyltransferase, partial [Spirochaetota bacterium]|nr:3-methyl-2-oxobutanoate hydroxymethyltransferase [Spirochaetota bacterium]